MLGLRFPCFFRPGIPSFRALRRAPPKTSWRSRSCSSMPYHPKTILGASRSQVSEARHRNSAYLFVCPYVPNLEPTAARPAGRGIHDYFVSNRLLHVHSPRHSTGDWNNSEHTLLPRIPATFGRAQKIGSPNILKTGSRAIN